MQVLASDSDFEVRDDFASLTSSSPTAEMTPRAAYKGIEMDWWNKSRKLAVLTTTFALSMAGCAEPAAVAPPVVEKAAQVSSKPKPDNKTKPANPSGDRASADQVEENPEKDAYAPPFPDRIDLFGAPKREGHSKAANGEYEEAVELIGFADLGRPLALLLFNGQITTLGEGESIYGVEVVSIQRPKVVLQRGRQRWQTSLEN